MDDETKIALVTGANRGIGLETARQLAEQGMIVLLGARDAAKGEAAARELSEGGLKVLMDVPRGARCFRAVALKAGKTPALPARCAPSAAAAAPPLRRPSGTAA